MNLKQAKAKNKLPEFIKEREKENSRPRAGSGLTTS
jgi:hypothetical protein